MIIEIKLQQDVEATDQNFFKTIRNLNSAYNFGRKIYKDFNGKRRGKRFADHDMERDDEEDLKKLMDKLLMSEEQNFVST